MERQSRHCWARPLPLLKKLIKKRTTWKERKQRNEGKLMISLCLYLCHEKSWLLHQYLQTHNTHLRESKVFPSGSSICDFCEIFYAQTVFGLKRMGSGDWFKTIISLKKSKTNKSRKVKGQLGTESNQAKGNNRPQKGSDKLEYGAPSGNSGVLQMSKIIAATRIQTAIRGFMARKTLRSLKGMQKLQIHTQRDNIVKQATTTLSYIHSWSNIQSQIRARRLNMVVEGRIKLKKQESQLKLEARLQELEMEWSGGSETMEETIARLQQREEAAVKRERAMAYAFSHQWRANSSQNQGQFVYESGKADWGWSWMERWIAVRPWETRLPAQTVSPPKIQSRLAGRVGKSTNLSPRKIHSSAKPIKSNGKGTTRATDVQKAKPSTSPGVEILVSQVTDPSPVVTK